VSYCVIGKNRIGSSANAIRPAAPAVGGFVTFVGAIVLTTGHGLSPGGLAIADGEPVGLHVVPTGGGTHAVTTAGQAVCVGGHCVWDGGQNVCDAGHCVWDGGHWVCTTGHWV
jgi:hypothetical protein